jgi:STAS-like domain of unknown function (DUF4325)
MTTTSISKTTDGYTVALAAWGPDLSGRTLGESVRQDVIGLEPAVVFDCTGIESMSPSFADEVFGKLASSPDSERPHISVVNAPVDVLSAIRFAVHERTR